jgi:hypothetical protein
MDETRSEEVIRFRPLLGGPRGIPVSVGWLRRGLATFLWASRRSLASLHQHAASFWNKQPILSLHVTDGVRLQLTGSFVQYLFERHGMERLRRFFLRAEKVGIESAARSVFGKGFFELEMEWETMVTSLES